MHAIYPWTPWLRISALLTDTISPALVDIQNLEKLFIVKTLAPSMKEVWESVASSSFSHQGPPLLRAGVLPGLSVPSAICAKGPTESQGDIPYQF